MASDDHGPVPRLVYTSFQRPPNVACSRRTPMSANAAAAPRPSPWGNFFQGLQKMGRSLQLPIAVLPAAGIVNRLGQPDVFGDDGLGWTNVSKVMAGAGGALLDGTLGLPLLFCVGVAIGMAKKSDGSTALAALAGFIISFNVLC